MLREHPDGSSTLVCSLQPYSLQRSFSLSNYFLDETHKNPWVQYLLDSQFPSGQGFYWDVYCDTHCQAIVPPSVISVDCMTKEPVVRDFM